MTDVFQPPEIPEPAPNEHCAWLRTWYRRHFGRATQNDTIVINPAARANEREPAGLRAQAMVETMKEPRIRRTPRQLARLAIQHFETTFGRIPPDGTATTALSDIKDEELRARLIELAGAAPTLDRLIEKLLVFAGGGARVARFLGDIRALYPSGVPADLTAAELLMQLPDNSVRDAAEAANLRSASDVVAFLENLKRQEEEE
jgi:hypothetical protein